MDSYSFKTLHLKIPFRYNYTHHLAKRSTTDSILLFLTLNNIVCVGETTPRQYVTGETTLAMPVLIKEYLPKVLAKFEASIQGLSIALQIIPPSYTALRCLLESALLNYLVQTTNKSLFQLFDVPLNQTFHYTASITGGTDKAFQQIAHLTAKYKMQRIKIKLTPKPEDNLSRVLYLKQLCGENINIRVDGNEIWTFDQAKKEVPQLIEAGVSCFEQLFHRDDATSYDNAFKEWGQDCEFIVDESITNIDSMKDLIIQNNVHGVCLKIAKNGGLIQSLEMARILKENQFSIRLGCHVGECSYLTLLGLVFAGLTNPIDLEGALGNNFLEYDPFIPNITFGVGGKIRLSESFCSKFQHGLEFSPKHIN